MGLTLTSSDLSDITTIKLSKSCRLKELLFSTLTGLELHPTITIND